MGRQLDLYEIIEDCEQEQKMKDDKENKKTGDTGRKSKEERSST